MHTYHMIIYTFEYIRYIFDIHIQIYHLQEYYLVIFIMSCLRSGYTNTTII